MNKRKTILLLTAVTLLLAATVGGTIAYLFTSSGPVVNEFEPGSVVPVIEEDFIDKTVKKNVWLWNSGTVDAYMRAAVVVTWQDGSGNVYSKAPVQGTDYTITFPANSKWVLREGYYYYTQAIKPRENQPALEESHAGTDYATAYLLTECEVKNGASVPSGYSLHVEILAQAIQTEPAQVFTDANWGWTPSSGS